ncbi:MULTISPECIES: histidine triad nucleotide-binding protein [unclassified Roseobacter]|uniref:histidine triad nucleotide-binding protein n=1 Tax=unclassified Roseobacter TaxID=196798 RepID=UPI0030ED4B93
MPHEYDPQNIFAKILRGEIPNNTVAETDHCLAFHDIGPQAPTHILVIPKGAYVTYDDFAQNASDAEILDFVRLTGRLCKELGLSFAEGGQGYRVISNAGDHGGQEVPHYHLHLLGGAALGPLLAKRSG